MDLKFVSPTRLKTVRTCEARAMAQLDVDYEEESGEAAHVGTLAHAAAEVWYTPKNHETFTELDQAFKAAIEVVSKDNELPGTKGVQEARSLFEQIAAAYPRDQIKVVFAERKYEGYLSSGLPVRLKVDLAIDHGDGTLEICDFKTGYIVMSDTDMYNEDQVLLNLLVVSQYDNELKDRYQAVQFTYFWVRMGFASKPVYLSPDRLRDYEVATAAEYRRILEVTEPRETVNQYCGSCGRRTQCTAYGKLMDEVMGQDYGKDFDLENMDLATMVKRASELKVAAKNIEAYGDHIKNAMKSVLQQNEALSGNPKMEGEGYKAWLQKQVMTNPDTKVVLQLAQRYNIPVDSIVSVSKAKMEEAFADHTDALREIQKTSRKMSGTPYVRFSTSNSKTKSKPKSKAKKAAEKGGE